MSTTPAVRMRQMRFLALVATKRFARSFSITVARPWRSYTDVLARGGWRSVLLKSVTAAAVSGGGDILCQKFVAPPHAQGEAGEEGGPAERRGAVGGIDWGRVGRFVAISTAFTPLGHAWYRYLALTFPGTGMRVACKRMLLDQLFYSPMCLGLYFSMVAVAENKGVEHLKRQLQSDWGETVVKSWMVWGPVQMCNFGYVPVHLQVLCTNCVGLFWNMYVSYVTHRGAGAGAGAVGKSDTQIMLLERDNGGDRLGGMSI